MAKKSKSVWILILFILAGIVVGGLIGELAKNVSWLSWLGYSKGFGLSEPVVLDISVMKITFGISINISIAMIIGVVIALIIYKLCIKK